MVFLVLPLLWFCCSAFKNLRFPLRWNQLYQSRTYRSTVTTKRHLLIGARTRNHCWSITRLHLIHQCDEGAVTTERVQFHEGGERLEGFPDKGLVSAETGCNICNFINLIRKLWHNAHTHWSNSVHIISRAFPPDFCSTVFFHCEIAEILFLTRYFSDWFSWGNLELQEALHVPKASLLPQPDNGRSHILQRQEGSNLYQLSQRSSV